MSNKPTVQKPFLTLAEAAAEIGMSHWTLRREIRLKRMAYHRRSPRGRILIFRADLQAYLTRCRIAAVGERF